jgi:ABC-type amino acid transport substrate-binding protein
MQDMVFDYMRSGGNPQYFGQWLRNTVESSFVPKVDKKLVELSKSGKWNEFMNMLAALQRGENRNEEK